VTGLAAGNVPAPQDLNPAWKPPTGAYSPGIGLRLQVPLIVTAAKGGLSDKLSSEKINAPPCFILDKLKVLVGDQKKVHHSSQTHRMMGGSLFRGQLPNLFGPSAILQNGTSFPCKCKAQAGKSSGCKTT